MKKALIIDDEPEICILVEQILMLRNINTEYVFSISETMTILDQYVPDVIFLDHKLSDGYGFEFIPHIRKLCPNAKIICISAQYDYIMESSICAGADSFIRKPFTIENIFKTLDTFN